jgi:hypothetical protein
MYSTRFIKDKKKHIKKGLTCESETASKHYVKKIYILVHIERISILDLRYVFWRGRKQRFFQYKIRFYG